MESHYPNTCWGGWAQPPSSVPHTRSIPHYYLGEERRGIPSCAFILIILQILPLGIGAWNCCPFPTGDSALFVLVYIIVLILHHLHHWGGSDWFMLFWFHVLPDCCTYLAGYLGITQFCSYFLGWDLVLLPPDLPTLPLVLPSPLHTYLPLAKTCHAYISCLAATGERGRRRGEERSRQRTWWQKKKEKKKQGQGKKAGGRRRKTLSLHANIHT